MRGDPLPLDATLVPPTADVYQRIVFPVEVALKVALAGAQIVPGEATIADGFAGNALTTTGTEFVEKTFPFALTVQVMV